MPDDRHADLIRFHSLLDALEAGIGGARKLADCSGRMDWPARGVYFFHEPGETRSDTGVGPRVVRVGTHALKEGSGTTLWSRLSQHRGQAGSGGGNHRGSIFRLIVGTALMQRDGLTSPTWGVGANAPREVKESELYLERKVSRFIGAMPFLWLAIEDEPCSESLRGYIERNSIALLSNYHRRPIDPPSMVWLGHLCNRERVRDSGLWNSNHVDEEPARGFLDVLEELVTDDVSGP